MISLVRNISPKNEERKNTARGAVVGAAIGSTFGYISKNVVDVKNGLTTLRQDVFERAVKNIEFDPFIRLEQIINEKELAFAKRFADKDINVVLQKKIEYLLSLSDEAKEQFGIANIVVEANNAKKDSVSVAMAIVDGVIEQFVGNEVTQMPEFASMKSFSDAKTAILMKDALKQVPQDTANIEQMKSVVAQYLELVRSGRVVPVSQIDTKTVLNSDEEIEHAFQILKSIPAMFSQNVAQTKEQADAFFVQGKKGFAKLAQDADSQTKALYKSVKNTVKSIKMKDAVIIGGLTALVCGFAGYLMDKNNSQKKH